MFGNLIGPLTGTAGIFFLSFLFAIVFLWILLPFALFGIKRHLRRNLAYQERILAELKAIRAAAEDRTAPPPALKDPSLDVLRAGGRS